MVSQVVQLEWRRDPKKRFRFIDAHDEPAAALPVPMQTFGFFETKPTMHKVAAKIVWEGDRWELYRPLAIRPTKIVNRFIGIIGGEGVLEFIKDFGFLGADNYAEDQTEEYVDTIIAFASILRDFAKVGKRRAAIVRLLSKSAELGTRLTAELAVDGSGDLMLRYTASNLLGAITYQASRLLVDGAKITVCTMCDVPFFCGPGTERRADSKFCSKEHQIRFNSLALGKKERPR